MEKYLSYKNKDGERKLKGNKQEENKITKKTRKVLYTCEGYNINNNNNNKNK